MGSWLASSVCFTTEVGPPLRVRRDAELQRFVQLRTVCDSRNAAVEVTTADWESCARRRGSVKKPQQAFQNRWSDGTPSKATPKTRQQSHNQ